MLRIRVGDCLTVKLENLLAEPANPNKQPIAGDPMTGEPPFNVIVDGQVKTRHVGFSVSGMQLVNNIGDIGVDVGANASKGVTGVRVTTPGGQRPTRCTPRRKACS